MPNILIIGFEQKRAEQLRELAEGVLQQLGEINDSCTTIVSAEARMHKLARQPDNPRSAKIFGRYTAPYLLVRHTSLRGAENIAIALNKAVQEDVEFEKMGGFIPARGSKEKKRK